MSARVPPRNLISTSPCHPRSYRPDRLGGEAPNIRDADACSHAITVHLRDTASSPMGSSAPLSLLSVYFAEANCPSGRLCTAAPGRRAGGPISLQGTSDVADPKNRTQGSPLSAACGGTSQKQGDRRIAAG
ncbi:hypothetical protein NDU88_003769 [Pleurodeles waltl]|uniref:Uncharacterized protein n=1 Tax=Pleurodeles waltl TaxID=8319 RepID=A0AAV7KZE4_PLEWA|nr:hypothetical protein NDU88_003769 [Pleurodeles waltl]